MSHRAYLCFKKEFWDFPNGPVVKNLPASTGDTGSIPDPTGRRATKPMRHNSRAWEVELLKPVCP